MRQQLTCGKCSTVTLLPVGYAPKDGDVLRCGGCQTSYAAHLCNHDNGLSALQAAVKVELLEVLVNGISKACPECGVWYKVGKVVERFDPQLGKAIQKVAVGAGVFVLVAAAIKFLNDRE